MDVFFILFLFWMDFASPFPKGTNSQVKPLVFREGIHEIHPGPRGFLAKHQQLLKQSFEALPKKTQVLPSLKRSQQVCT